MLSVMYMVFWGRISDRNGLEISKMGVSTAHCRHG